MAQIQINIPGYYAPDGQTPIVILGPNGSGKTQLAQKIAQGGNVAGHGAVAERNQNPRALADQTNIAQMILVGDGAFDQSNIDVFGKFFNVFISSKSCFSDLNSFLI